jgi:hypothetical protein
VTERESERYLPIYNGFFFIVFDSIALNEKGVSGFVGKIGRPFPAGYANCLLWHSHASFKYSKT